MFKKDKDIEQRTSNAIKNKDFKKLKSDLVKQFPLNDTSGGRGLSEDSLVVLFPPKCSITCTKLSNRTLVYCVDTIPYFFDLNGRCDYYPTVFALWKLPDILPQIVIHSPVSVFVLRGADLMAPGVYKLDEGIRKGDKVSIRVRNNSLPFAVAMSEVNSEEDFGSAVARPRGKAAEVQHAFGDCLWKGVAVAVPNVGFSVVTVVTGDGQDGSDSESENSDDNNEGDEEDQEDDADEGVGDKNYDDAAITAESLERLSMSMEDTSGT